MARGYLPTPFNYGEIKFIRHCYEWTPPEGWHGPIEHSQSEFSEGMWCYFVWMEV